MQLHLTLKLTPLGPVVGEEVTGDLVGCAVGDTDGEGGTTRTVSHI